MPEEPSDFGNEHTENSIAKFQTLSAEGDLLLQRGAFQESLDVYTRALAIHPTDKHCLYQKAEALYAQSDFELALMYYHRGHRLRPELNEFRTGIQKAREAIDNSIGDAKNMRIYVPAKLRRNLAALAAAQPSMSDGGMGGSSPLASNAVEAAAWCKLLGELYEDKLFLQEMLNDHDSADYGRPGADPGE
ncbi:hypothetical protein BSLG_003592 [Batrachochytrium salamandrivorans]|nr:hypothetical protein BSLG_003592 [Batrachochytrium salamandrivorans]